MRPALDEATALYRKALAVRPDWTDGWWGLGTILYETDVCPDAARAFVRVVALDPKNGTAHLMLALCEYQVDRDASAMAHIAEIENQRQQHRPVEILGGSSRPLAETANQCQWPDVWSGGGRRP